MLENKMTVDYAAEVLRVLSETFPLLQPSASNFDAFKTLVAAILSQNTTDGNAEKAFEKLSSRFEIKPQVLAAVDVEKIEEQIKVSGLHKSKARAIKHASETLMQKFGGSMAPIFLLPLEEARKTLMRFHGVGPKTADVVLLFAAKMPTLPVDTHITRVAKRLGFAPQDGDYETVRKRLQRLFSSKDFLKVHLLLIYHGRTYCKARNPQCRQCPISRFCVSKTLAE
jgi:endonuclease-3